MLRRYCKAGFICLVISLLSCCHKRPGRISPEVRSFYYWKSVYATGAKERAYLHALRVNRLYVHFFDVTWNDQQYRPAPTAVIRFSDTSYSSYSVIPVVFISNDVFARLDTADVRLMAGNIAGLVTQLRNENNIARADELQLDCDWTATTRDRYFALLSDMRKWLDAHDQTSCGLSATIRLYQCKYRDLTGVPPVAKGLLMCYNMGDLKNIKAHNSILETAEMEKYTDRLSTYPLPLDVALPIFSWKVVYRGGQYAGLVEGLPTAALNNDVVMRSGNRYTFRRDTILDGYTFAAGDQLRDEESSYDVVAASAQVIARKLKSPPGAVLLFHLDSSNLSNYTTDELENVFSYFD